MPQISEPGTAATQTERGSSDWQSASVSQAGTKSSGPAQIGRPVRETMQKQVAPFEGFLLQTVAGSPGSPRLVWQTDWPIQGQLGLQGAHRPSMQSSPAAQTRHAPPSWPQFWKVFPGKQTLGFPGSLPQQPDLLAAQLCGSQKQLWS